MNPEFWLIIMPALGLVLFALGGTQISPTTPGKKWLRRFVLPAFWGGCVFLAGFTPWRAVGVAILSCALFHLGYGDKTPWRLKIALFGGYGLISAFIGLSWWNPITFIGCAVMMVLSNLKLTSATMVWKVVEGFFGAVIGVQLGYLMAGNGLIWR